MLKSIRLVRFKGFPDCTVPLAGTSVLVGANNAGKSSVISALRLVAAMVPQMRRLEPNTGGVVDAQPMRGWRLTNAAVEAASFNDENVRFEFGSEQTRLEAAFDSGAKVTIVWPDQDDEDLEPTCHLIVPDSHRRGALRAAARDLVPTLGVVPSLAPLDDHEQLIGDDALRRNLTGRRTSRYFRNALMRVEQDPVEWASLTDFLLSNTPEIDHLELRSATTRGELDLFFRESGGRQQREITWAGDGIQIWLQALYHLWRERDATVVVLDEPDVYLHPDLQRRLARMVFDQPKQIVLATHSTEILAEAEPGAAVWIDRGRRRAERPRRDGALTMLGRRLGSGLELGIARALRSSVALFVEGQDMRILAKIAATLEAAEVAHGRNFAVVPLGGLTRYGVAGGFSEVVAALGGQVDVHVLLDRDLRSTPASAAIISELEAQRATVHMWERRELENYLIAPEAIAHATGLDVATSAEILNAEIEACRQAALTDLQTQRLEERDAGHGVTRAVAQRTVLQTANIEFETLWSTEVGRLTVVDAKVVIKRVSAELQSRRLRTINADKLARSLPREAVAPDMARVIARIDAAVAGR